MKLLVVLILIYGFFINSSMSKSTSQFKVTADPSTGGWKVIQIIGKPILGAHLIQTITEKEHRSEPFNLNKIFTGPLKRSSRKISYIVLTLHQVGGAISKMKTIKGGVGHKKYTLALDLHGISSVSYSIQIYAK